MNQKGREFLAEHVRKAYKKKDTELKEQLPKEPEMNNYVLEAFLSGTIEFRPHEEIQKNLRDFVLQRGDKEALIRESYGRYDGEAKITDRKITLPPAAIFVMPSAYQEAHDAWEAEYDRIQTLRDQLREYEETILLKINIGSDKVLDELVAQADNLVDLALVKNRLVMASEEPEKKLLKAV